MHTGLLYRYWSTDRERLKPDNKFDGDTGSLTAVMLNDSLEENRRYMSTRIAWVKPSGRMRASVVYDTTELVVRNLTGRFPNHVKDLASDQKVEQLRQTVST